jgi:hypothetical protein
MSSRPNLVEARLQRSPQRLLIANVVPHRAGFLNELDRRGQIVRGGQRVGNRCDLVTDVDRDDVRAVGRQPHRLRTALTAGRAGDERNLAVECTHWCLASSR